VVLNALGVGNTIRKRGDRIRIGWSVTH
jgi:hypothetical protein